MMKRLFILGVIAVIFIGEANAQEKSYAQKMAATVMQLWPDSFTLSPGKPAKWQYDQGVILKGFEGLWYQTGDPVYFNYIQKCMDFYVSNDGKIKGYKPTEYNIDHVNNGKLLLLLYRVTGKEKYWKAATSLREQLRTHPRTREGGFWHKKIYTNQMWLDGLYMGEPFYAEYASLSHEDTAFNDIANQFIWMENHSRDSKTGLLYHGWDESKEQKWANKTTGTSPHFWGRAMGWYAMALVDVLDYFPTDHPKRENLIAILNRLVTSIQKVQDTKTGLWYQVLDKGNSKGNYLEASASNMFTYAVAKGIRKGYLGSQFTPMVKKAWDGIQKKFLYTNNDGQLILSGTVSVAGLGGSPYRDGSYEYYLSEPVIDSDPKGIGAFLLAANEMKILPQLSTGMGKKVLLDNFYNNETKKDITGQTIPYHYTWDDMSNSGFALLGSLFEQQGAKIATLNEAPTAANLATASVYVIVDPDTEKETAKPNFVQPRESNIIYNWVKNGGVLALLSNDRDNVEFTHFNQLAGLFGIQFNEDSENKVVNNDFGKGVVYISKGNPVFTSGGKMYIKELSTLQVKSPATSIVKLGDKDIIAIAKVGKGLVFAVGDPWFYNEYVDGRKLPFDFENFTAANDLVKWLLKNSKK